MAVVVDAVVVVHQAVLPAPRVLRAPQWVQLPVVRRAAHHREVLQVVVAALAVVEAEPQEAHRAHPAHPALPAEPQVAPLLELAVALPAVRRQLPRHPHRRVHPQPPRTASS